MTNKTPFRLKGRTRKGRRYAYTFKDINNLMPWGPYGFNAPKPWDPRVWALMNRPCFVTPRPKITAAQILKESTQ